MLRVQSAAVLLFVTAAFVQPSAAQEQSRGTVDPSRAKAPAAEGPMSIFNDQVRRFRFVLEEMLITTETAEAFMIKHQLHNEPPIIGAYADSETNSLVVVGPPEAEQPIRETLAQWMVERQQVSPPPLNVQKRTLEFRRKELLCTMAGLEVQLVGEEGDKAEGDKAEQIRQRLSAFERELAIVEKQLEVVDRYVQRLENQSTATVARTGVIANDGSAPAN